MATGGFSSLGSGDGSALMADCARVVGRPTPSLTVAGSAASSLELDVSQASIAWAARIEAKRALRTEPFVTPDSHPLQPD